MSLRMIRGMAMALALGACALLPGTAMADSHWGALAQMSAQTGEKLDALRMSQLDVYARHRQEIVDVAIGQVLGSDAHGEQLTAAALASYRSCSLMGVMPLGAATAAESHPMHACTHVTLALTAALLQHLMLTQPTAEVQALNATVQRELAAQPRYSFGDICAAAQPVDVDAAPLWPSVPGLVSWYAAENPVAATLLALAALLGLGLLGWSRLRPHAQVMRRPQAA